MLARTIAPAVMLGFLVGIAVGITLEASGVLERLDAAIGSRLRPRPAKAVEGHSESSDPA